MSNAAFVLRFQVQTHFYHVIAVAGNNFAVCPGPPATGQIELICYLALEINLVWRLKLKKQFVGW